MVLTPSIDGPALEHLCTERERGVLFLPKLRTAHSLLRTNCSALQNGPDLSPLDLDKVVRLAPCCEHPHAKTGTFQLVHCIPVRMCAFQSVLPSINLVSAAPNNLAELDIILSEIQGQAEVTRSLLRAEQELKGTLTHNIKFNRLRPTLRFIYGPSSEDDTFQRHRQEKLATLGHASKALCALTFTPHALLRLGDSEFNALTRGIAAFVEKKGLAEVIDSQIGQFIHRTLKELLGDGPTRFIWIDNKPLQRRKTTTKQNAACETAVGDLKPVQDARPPLHRYDRAKDGLATSTPQTLQEDNITTSPSELVTAGSHEFSSSQGYPKPHSGEATGTIDICGSEQKDVEASRDGACGSLPELPAGFASALSDELRASWFGRGIDLSEIDILQQLEEWPLMGEDMPMPEIDYEVVWSGP